MFFSQELLSRRDSGFGLLWLAATLGSKSTFKRLTKRSILTADISELCDLISQPSEPLALRLSSNLLIGVARVYKGINWRLGIAPLVPWASVRLMHVSVKQEIFLTDVTACFTSLKKVVQEMRTSISSDAQLQMAQPLAKRSAVTILADSRAALNLDFDILIADWNAFLNTDTAENAHEDYNPNVTSRDIAPEVFRAVKHTLEEHHEHLLSASFDMSFQRNDGLQGESSSQGDVNFPLDDNDMFALQLDGFDLDGLANELAEELGWTELGSKEELMPVEGDTLLPMDFTFPEDQLHLQNDGNFDVDVEHTTANEVSNLIEDSRAASALPDTFEPCQPSPATSFSHAFPSRQKLESPRPVQNIEPVIYMDSPNISSKGLKRTRLLSDMRIELTDDELKAARSRYLQTQQTLKRSVDHKALKNNRSQRMAEIIWGVPSFINAPTLVKFWKEVFKVQTEGRIQMLAANRRADVSLHHMLSDIVDTAEEPPRKRRKSGDPPLESGPHEAMRALHLFDVEPGVPMDMDMDIGLGPTGNDDFSLKQGIDTSQVLKADPIPNDFRALRSSEEPGQGRRTSRPASVLGDLHFNLVGHNPATESQKSSLFPWDHAGGGSTSSVFGLPGSNNTPIRSVDIKLRASQKRRDNSIGPSQVGGPGLSPTSFAMRGSPAMTEDFRFQVDAQANTPTRELRPSDANLVNLEKNSFNFLEYVKMQAHTLSSAAVPLTFDTVVPKLTSTRHVAASAFYHCLVLATKNLLHVKQEEAYGSFVILVA